MTEQTTKAVEIVVTYLIDGREVFRHGASTHLSEESPRQSLKKTLDRLTFEPMLPDLTDSLYESGDLVGGAHPQLMTSKERYERIGKPIADALTTTVTNEWTPAQPATNAPRSLTEPAPNVNTPPLDGVRRVGPFIEDFDDGVFEHMGAEYKGGVWLYTLPVETEQALERAEFMKRACWEAQDIAAKAQEDAARYRWLRSLDHDGIAAFEITDRGAPVLGSILIGGHLDNAIDAAINAEMRKEPK